MESLLSYLHMVPLPVAILVSIGLNCLIAIAGVIPSAFLTAANVALFGFWGGFSVSLIGEITGSLLAFWLYRKGFKKGINHLTKHAPRLQKLLHASSKEAFLLVIGLRLMPFVPAGLVTLYAAISTMRFGAFAWASSIGKVPALWLEVIATSAVMNFFGQAQFILLLTALSLLSIAWIKIKHTQS